MYWNKLVFLAVSAALAGGGFRGFIENGSYAAAALLALACSALPSCDWWKPEDALGGIRRK